MGTVVVITLPPTPHIYETTDVLRASETTYDKFTVLVRHNEGVDRASTKECANLLRLKQVTFRSNHGAPPVAFGATIGAIVGGAVASSFAGQKLMAAKHNWVVASIMGATVDLG
jgi:hypothetical protein